MIRVHHQPMPCLPVVSLNNDAEVMGGSNSLNFIIFTLFPPVKRPVKRTRMSNLSEPKTLGMGRTNFPSESLRLIVSGSSLVPFLGSQIHYITYRDLWCVLEDGTSPSLVPQLELSLSGWHLLGGREYDRTNRCHPHSCVYCHTFFAVRRHLWSNVALLKIQSLVTLKTTWKQVLRYKRWIRFARK